MSPDSAGPADPVRPVAAPQPAAGRFATRLAGLILRLRWLWFLAAAGLLALSLLRIGETWPPDPSARVFFAPENPDRQALDRFEAVFAKEDTLMFVLEPEGGDVFAPRVLAAIGALTERAWRLPMVRRVDSLTNFPHTQAEGDEMIVRDLVPDPAGVTPAGAEAARAIARGRIELAGNFLGPAGDVTQVQVKFLLPDAEPTREVPMIVAEVRQLVEAYEAEFPFMTVRLTGSVMINNQFAVSGQDDAKNLLGPMFLVILLVVGLALRSALATGAVLVVIALSAVVGLGALGWAGLPLNSVTVLAPLYIMTLAVASAVHVLASARQTMVETADRQEWMRRALSEHMGAIAIACVTTAIGFFSLNFSISPPFRQLGNIVGAGVLAALFLTLTLLPALVTVLPIRRRTAPPATGLLMARFGDWVVRHNRSILPATAALALGSMAGIGQLALEDDFLRYFDERYEFRQDTDFTEARLVGVNALEFPLPSGAAQGINEPAWLAEVAGFADWLRAQPHVTSVITLTDTLKRLNMNMHGDDPAFERLPATREEASQYLFLYELSLGYGMDLADRIDIDRSALRVTVTLANVTTADMRALTLRAGDWIAQNAPITQAAWAQAHPGLAQVTPTGIPHVFNLISHRDVRAMLLGTAVAMVLISGVILLALRDLRIGLLSLVPNLLPGLMAFGLWGYSVGAVTLAIAVVFAGALGIVVDDTVHFLARYTRARRQGLGAEDAVRAAFRTVGMAMLVTTLGLAGGFAVLAQSGFAVNGDLARLMCLTVAIALAADVLLLPALLIRLDQGRPAMTAHSRPAAAALVALCLGAGLLAPPAQAQTPAEKGLAIAEEADRRDLGFGAYRVQGQMILRDASGNESVREFESLVHERTDPGLGDMGVIVFSRPRDIRGTGLLTHANIEPADDDQWLYLPAVKRVKRISSSNRSGKFVSSEFSYEDLGSQEVPDYTYAWLRDEPCPTDTTLTCHVVDSFPKNPKSGYSRRTSWTDSTEYRIQRVEFFNRRGELEKVLTFSGYREYKGKHWRPDLMRMENRQTGKATDLVWRDYDFGAALSEADFDPSRLPLMAE